LKPRQSTKLGAFDFWKKPLSIGKVSWWLKNALAHRARRLRTANSKADSGARYRITGKASP